MDFKFTMRIALAFLAIGAVLFAVALNSRADEYYSYVDVSCNPDKGEVLIRPATLENAQPTLTWHGKIKSKNTKHFRVSNGIDYGECLLTAGKTLRLKVSEGKALPYGACGGDPEVSLSLWVDKRHWLKQWQFSGRCTTTPATKITVTTKGVRWCSIKTDLAGEPLPEAKEACEFTPASKMPTQPDVLEYPTKTRAKKLSGTIEIVRGSENPLCNSMLKKEDWAFRNQPYWTVQLPNNALSVDVETDHGNYEYAGQFSKRQLDIDNDGKSEVIYGFHPTNHAHDADVYFVASGGNIRSMEPNATLEEFWPALTPEMLWQGSSSVFPNSLGDCEKRPCGMDDDDASISLKGYRENGKPFEYRLRYLHAEPFSVNGVTYFLLTSLDSDSDHISAVLMPKKNQHPKETCVFRRIKEHY